MRSAARFSLLITVIIFSSLLLTEFVAYAQCPWGTHWSPRYGYCLPNRQPPPPPYEQPYGPPPGGPGYGPRGPGGYGPGPVPHGGGCKNNYEACLMTCRGNTNCIFNCRVSYDACRNN